MKVLFNTLYLESKIKEAIDNHSTTFDIDGQKCTIIFHGNTDVHGFVETTAEHRKSNYSGVFDSAQWTKLLNFIKQLPEQPIVFEVRQYMHTDVHQSPEIILSEFDMIL